MGPEVATPAMADHIRNVLASTLKKQESQKDLQSRVHKIMCVVDSEAVGQDADAKMKLIKGIVEDTSTGPDKKADQIVELMVQSLEGKQADKETETRNKREEIIKILSVPPRPSEAAKPPVSPTSPRATAKIDAPPADPSSSLRTPAPPGKMPETESNGTQENDDEEDEDEDNDKKAGVDDTDPTTAWFVSGDGSEPNTDQLDSDWVSFPTNDTESTNDWFQAQSSDSGDRPGSTSSSPKFGEGSPSTTRSSASKPSSRRSSPTSGSTIPKIPPSPKVVAQMTMSRRRSSSSRHSPTNSVTSPSSSDNNNNNAEKSVTGTKDSPASSPPSSTTSATTTESKKKDLEARKEDLVALMALKRYDSVSDLNAMKDHVRELLTPSKGESQDSLRARQQEVATILPPPIKGWGAEQDRQQRDQRIWSVLIAQSESGET